MDKDLEMTNSKVIEKKAEFKGRGLIATGVFVTAVGGVYAVVVPFLLPALRRICIPFVPATTRQTKNVFKLLEGRQGTLVDLGSGDGRLVLEAARRGFHSTGYELNPWLVWYSRAKARQQGLTKMTEFYWQNLWKTDLTKYNHVVIFGVTSMMEPLQTKLARELKIDGKIVTSRVPFPGWTPIATIDEGLDSAWLYDRTSINTAGFGLL